MEAHRIAELLEPFLSPASGQRLTTNDLSNISTYIDLLIRWNARINLTAIRDLEQIVTRHFGESLFAARHLFPDRNSLLSSRPECVGERSESTHAVERPCISVDAPRHAPDVRTHAAVHEGTHAASPEPSPGRRAERSEAIGGTNAGAGDTESLAPSDTKAAERRQSAVHGVSRGLENAPSQAPEGRKKLSLADLGSGPGFPGLPIKLWAPDISLTLIESNHKKATFLREITRALTLTDVNIQIARAESLPPQTFDVVILRAVEHFNQILPAAAALVRPEARLALLIGKAQIPQANSILPTFTRSDPYPIPNSSSRVLWIGHK